MVRSYYFVMFFSCGLWIVLDWLDVLCMTFEGIAFAYFSCVQHLTFSRFHSLQIVCSAPLTTPEEAQLFLQSMREKTQEREFSHHPPCNLNSAGLDEWFMQQRQRERDMRERRREAEALLRGYRGGRESLGLNSTRNAPLRMGRESLGSVVSAAPRGFDWEDGTGSASHQSGSGSSATNRGRPQHIQVDTAGFPTASTANSSRSTASGGAAGSESLDDPRSFFHNKTNRSSLQQRESYVEEKKSTDSLHDLQPVVENVVGDTEIHANVSTDSMSLMSPAPAQDHEGEPPEPPTVWLDFISNEPGAKFPPAVGRYHLYLSYACPGSHRALIVRALKGLEDVVSVTYVHPAWRLTNPNDPSDKHRGWVFGNPGGEAFPNTIHRGGPFPAAYSGNEADPMFNAYSIREIYQKAGDTSGKYTIPLLWDTETGTIVNNESSDIAYMLNSSFNDFAINPDLDLYTEYDEEGMAKLNEVSDWLAPLMIHGVYRCGFAKNQRAYDKAIAELCEAFDRADDILQQQRYLTGNDVLTDADIRLFCSLLRFDEVYSIYFKANARLVMLTPALLNFCREIYQIDGVAETCNMEQIKAHFFGSHAEWNKYSVIPRGLGFIELLDMPHDRYLLTDDDEQYEEENFGDGSNNQSDNIDLMVEHDPQQQYGVDN